MKIKLAIMLVVLLACNKSHAVPITLFQNSDTFLKRAKDIVVAKCISIPERSSESHPDGLYPVQVEVLMVVKGDKKPGPLRIGTIYPMEQDSRYLLTSLGGSALGTDFLALPELSVVPIPPDFDLGSLKGKGAKEQVQKVFSRYLYEVEQKLAPLQKAQGLLEQALRDRQDDLYESQGHVRITAIHEAATNEEGQPRYLDLKAGKLQWSHAEAGKSGYLCFSTAGKNGPSWEFAPSPHKDIGEFDGKPLKAKFYGQFSPSLPNALGRAGENSVRVAVGEGARAN